jgi:hypothetical protein
MMNMPMTVNSIDGVHTVFTETGESGSIQRQLITPPTRPLHLEVRHHSGRVALQTVALVDPHAGPVVGTPHDPDDRVRRHVDYVLERSPGGLLSVDLEGLEKRIRAGGMDDRSASC